MTTSLGVFGVDTPASSLYYVCMNVCTAYGTTVKFTNRTRTTVKLSFVKFPNVKYNNCENTNREIIINICIIWIYITYIYL